MNALVSHCAHNLVSVLVSVDSLVGRVGVGVSESEVHLKMWKIGKKLINYKIRR